MRIENIIICFDDGIRKLPRTGERWRTIWRVWARVIAWEDKKAAKK